MTEMDKSPLVLLCRTGFERTLADEAGIRTGGELSPLRSGKGWVAFPWAGRERQPQIPAAAHGQPHIPAAVNGQPHISPAAPSTALQLNPPGINSPRLKTPHPLAEPLVFERQRLPQALWLPMPPAGENLRTLVDALLQREGPRLFALPKGGNSNRLALHVFEADASGETSRNAAINALEKYLRERLPADALAGSSGPAPASPHLIWQLCLVEDGVWSSICSPKELSHPAPGGMHQMPRDPLAPSRSYLKIEEALLVMGAMPRHRQTVIDLGAAPGGWSYAFLRRGCRVMAVDNGPLKIKGLDEMPGTLEHRREDGLRFRPPASWLPVDWLLSDMLISPGLCLGLLRKWLDAGDARQFVVNIKLPQQDPLVALRPVWDYLDGLKKKGRAQWRMRQLYHDRREVTLMGEMQLPAGKTSAKGPAVKGPAAKGTAVKGSAPALNRQGNRQQPALQTTQKRKAAPNNGKPKKPGKQKKGGSPNRRNRPTNKQRGK